jgi:hypothetical protein
VGTTGIVALSDIAGGTVRVLVGAWIKFWEGFNRKMAPAKKFKYFSSETRTLSVAGKRMTRKNIVSVDGKHGKKRVEQWSNGTRMAHSEHELSAKEIANIQARRFMPKLFALPTMRLNMIINGGKRRSATRRRKTNRRS